MIRKIQWIAMVVAAVLCAACDAHIDVPDTAVRPGHILCEDGTALSYVQYEQSGKRAIAVVFDTEHREGTEGNGYAVYLWDIAPAAFADSLGVAQGTSADIEVPNLPVAVDAWGRSACYPQGSFYPLSDGISTHIPPDH